jgi:acid phosphatase
MPLATTLAAESNPVPKETNTDTSNSHGNSPKAEKEPRAIALDAIPGHQQDTDLVTFPIAWKRLQFRVATGNNGRRKELQQHFVVRLKVVATLLNGARVSICEAQSAPIIVRGRSPRNFQSRKDLPLSASTTTSRKRREVGEKRSFAQNSASEPNMAPEQASFLATMPHDSSIDSLSLSGFSQSTRDQRRTHNVPAPINLYILDGGKSDSTNLNKETATLAAQPIDLSNNFIITPASGPPAKVRKLHSCDISRTQPTKTSAMVPLLNTPNTPNAQEPFASTADALYEYFPLPLDEMELPVDAVYRPHVVHHTNNDLYFTAKVEGKGYFVAAKHVVLSTRMRK